ncbi:hypothetical protein [Roseivirga sp. 4D4]|uniref:hypothetical protein n=1 Tax=Roseivirga sp. 4D4 TaxID=1889784 RepID=UPI000A47CE84|nr:hypothetical protein [Roseivirga sp. 4D4]
MKKILLLLTSVCLTSTLSAQWLGTNPVYFNSGNVGIGTSSPWAPLTISSTSTSGENTGVALAFSGQSLPEIGFRFKANGSNYYQVIYNGSSVQWRNWDGSAYTPRLTLTNAGNVGIGTTSPNSLLHLDSDSNTDLTIESGPNLSSTLKLVEQGTGDVGTYLKYDGANNRFGIFVGNNSPVERLSILRDNGSVGIGDINPNTGNAPDPNRKLMVNGGITVAYGQKISYDKSYYVHAYSSYDASLHTEARFRNYGYYGVTLESRSGSLILRGDNGNVGIGTTSPNTKLEVDGIARFTGTNGFSIGGDAGQYRIQNYGTGQEFGFLTPGNTYAGIRVRSSSIGSSYGGLNAPTNGAIIQGNVGIGISTPSEKLEVNGTIRSKKVKVDANGWPDYVFASSYELRALSEVERYIKENQHLPDVPSAKDVETNGLDLGDMDASLLKKVEELTLYTIDQQKKIDQQAKENQELKDRLSKIESLLKTLTSK